MNYTITVDAGNTKIKCALFNSQDECLDLFEYAKLEEIIKSFKLTIENTEAVVSNVTKNKMLIPFQSLEIHTLFKENKFLDMDINYNETLGLDRIAIAYLQFKSMPLPALLIDTGTFTTIDTVSSKGFEGGYILPGLEIIENSYLRGANLPKANAIFSDLLDAPHATLEAVSKGAALTYLIPIEKLVQHKSLEVIVITGGNSNLLSEYLSKSCASPLQVDENLIHKALFFIKNMVK